MDDSILAAGVKGEEFRLADRGEGAKCLAEFGEGFGFDFFGGGLLQAWTHNGS